MSGYLYVMSDGDAYKIGITKKSAEERRRQLQTGNPRTITVMYEFKCNDASAVESHLHDALGSYEIPGGGTEWFRFEELSPLHLQLNRLIEDRRMVSTGRYTGEVSYLDLLAGMFGRKSAIVFSTLAVASLAFLIWSGAFL